MEKKPQPEQDTAAQSLAAQRREYDPEWYEKFIAEVRRILDEIEREE